MYKKENNQVSNYKDNEIPMDMIKYLYKINRELIRECVILFLNKFYFLDDEDSTYKNLRISKNPIVFPKDEEIHELYKKMCTKITYDSENLR